MKRYFVMLFLLLPLSTQAAVSDAEIQKLMNAARERITRAKLNDGSFVPAETAEEKKSPIIPLNDGRRIIDRGGLSAIAEWCGIDYLPSYLQFMQNERKNYHWNDKQSSYVGLLHGMSVAVHRQGLKDIGLKTCSDAQKQHTLKQLSKE